MFNSNNEYLGKGALENAIDQINDLELKGVASRYGLILIEYVFGIRKPDNHKREQFLKGLRQELNSMHDRVRYDKEIENFINATIALLQNLTGDDLAILFLSLKHKSSDQIIIKKNPSLTTQKKPQTPSKKPNHYKKKKYTRNKTKKPLLPVGNSSSYDPNYLSIQKKAKIAIQKELDAKRKIQRESKKGKDVSAGTSSSGKYSNRPLPSNGYVKGKLDPSQTKRAQDDREDWKKIRKSRY